MIRGLKFKEINKSESGKTIVVLKESALRETDEEKVDKVDGR